MRISLEEISPVKKKLFVEIDSSEVDKKINEAYKELKKMAKVPGFRQGKAPRTILERHYGAQVVEDVTRTLISDSFPKALEEAETFSLGAPLLEKETLKKGENFKYSAVMEVRPQFEVDNYLELEVKKEKMSVKEEDLQDQLDQIRNNYGKLTSILQERPVRKDDYVALDYEGFEGEKPMEEIKASNFLLVVGKNDFHPKFEEALIGRKKGSSTEIMVEFEDSYYHAKLAGKKVNFKVKIIDIKKMILPELNDEFAKTLGTDFDGLDDLKDKIREAKTTQEEKRINGELKQRIIQKITEDVDIEIPQVLVQSELDFAVENAKQTFLRSGSSLEKAGISEERLKNDFRPASEKRVKEMIVLGEIAKKEKIEVDEDDITEGFKELASATGQDVESIRKYYEAGNIAGSFKEKLLEEKTLSYLVDHSKIIEVEKTELNQTDSN